MSENFAPIIVFTYLRLEKLKKLIDNLKQNLDSKKSDIYIFSDNAKYKKDINKIKKVRKYINTISGFRKKTIILRDKNFGNGRNIIEGVTFVLKKREKAIILEDDLEIGDNFLYFMNTCLTKYKNIVPCGISNKGVTNLKEISNQNYKNLSDIIVNNFTKNLEI